MSFCCQAFKVSFLLVSRYNGEKRSTGQPVLGNIGDLFERSLFVGHQVCPLKGCVSHTKNLERIGTYMGIVAMLGMAYKGANEKKIKLNGSKWMGVLTSHWT
jgi:hypothetical protein